MYLEIMNFQTPRDNMSPKNLDDYAWIFLPHMPIRAY